MKGLARYRAERLEAISRGNAAFVAEILKAYVQDSTRHMKELGDRMDAGDWTLAGRSAHTLKGSSANIGAERMGELSLRMQKACEAAEAAQARGILSEMRGEFSLLAEELKKSAPDA